jgi:hypothetical protein
VPGAVSLPWSESVAGPEPEALLKAPDALRELFAGAGVMPDREVITYCGTIKFRSFKTFDLQARRSYTVLLAIALFIALVSAHPALALVTLSYGYMLSAFVEMLMTRLHHAKPEVVHANVYDISKEKRLTKNE